ncbi:MAG: hypothetical protein K2P70_02950 [Hyphomonadaceae bacterium]|nr:hypothetical protein [Hyphomonadaceae bacterium]
MKRIVIACALALAACGQQNAEQKQDEAFPVVTAPNYDSSIGPRGAAGIHSPLPMDIAAIRAAAPNFMVASVQDQIEGNPFTAITLSAGDEEVFRVLPTADGARVHSIVTRSGQARGPDQDIVGVATFALAPAEEVRFCASENFDGSAGFACSTAEDGNFWRVYRVPESYDGPSDPFDAIDPDVLHDSTLVEMRWVAPRV